MTIDKENTERKNKLRLQLFNARWDERIKTDLIDFFLFLSKAEIFGVFAKHMTVLFAVPV